MPAARPARRATRKAATKAAVKSVKSPSKRVASPARTRAEFVAPVPFPQAAAIAVPTLGPGVTADASFAALRISAKAASGTVSSPGVVFLRGTLFADPAHPAGAPCTLFTLPVGMRPSCDGYLHAAYRDQGPGPVVPVLLKLDTSGRVGLMDGPPLLYDSMIWLDGISFLL